MNHRLLLKLLLLSLKLLFASAGFSSTRLQGCMFRNVHENPKLRYGVLNVPTVKLIKVVGAQRLAEGRWRRARGT